MGHSDIDEKDLLLALEMVHYYHHFARGNKQETIDHCLSHNLVVGDARGYQLTEAGEELDIELCNKYPIYQTQTNAD